MSCRVRPALGALAFVVLASVTFGLLPASAQQVSTLDISGVSVQSDRLVASVAVLDAGGNPVGGLTASSFTAQIDGSRADIRGVGSSLDSALPLGIVLTVDTSGSMAGASVSAARDAIIATVNALGPSDQAALITFAQTVNRTVEPTSDRAALSAAIAAMQATGNTALFAGVSGAASAAAALPQPRKAVLLLSDGEDFGSASAGITRDQALAAARSAGAPFFVVGLGAEVDQQFLSALADATGGHYFAAATPTELSQLYARISDHLRQQYTVSVGLPSGLAPGSHQLTIGVAAASARAAFSLPNAVAPPKTRLSPIPGALTEPLIVTLSDVPAGVSPRFTVDGAVIRAEPNGRSIRLDPYDWEPSRPHTLAVTFPPDVDPAASTTFAVAALAPQLVQPTSLPNLQPGELVRLTVRAQPPGATVRYLVDSVERGRNDAAPYEFVLPADGFSTGSHQLRVILQSAGNEASATFPFEAGAAAKKGRNIPLIVMGSLAVFVVLALLALLVRRLLKRRSEHRLVVEATREVERLSASTPQTAAAEGPTAQPWGMLRVTAGPDAGKVFELRAETELAGTGRHCTVRLTDKSLAGEHFIVSQDGTLAASSPANAVSVGGVPTRARALGGHERLTAGATELEFVRLERAP